MNLFNLFGTGKDLNTGTFLTLNGKEQKILLKILEKPSLKLIFWAAQKKEVYFLGWLVILTVIRNWSQAF